TVDRDDTRENLDRNASLVSPLPSTLETKFTSVREMVFVASTLATLRCCARSERRNPPFGDVGEDVRSARPSNMTVPEGPLASACAVTLPFDACKVAARVPIGCPLANKSVTLSVESPLNIAISLPDPLPRIFASTFPLIEFEIALTVDASKFSNIASKSYVNGCRLRCTEALPVRWACPKERATLLLISAMRPFTSTSPFRSLSRMGSVGTTIKRS